MARALYRTHRSRSLDEVIGQEHITDLLKHALASGAISHAYLLTGPRGTGKTSIARILAHEVNGLTYSDDPHLDIIEIDAASNRRIDDIRDLRDKVRIAPVSAKFKVYIIDEVHMLTTESFNALLKTLEEPPEHVIFIMATTEVHKVPATILSRTQRFHLRPVAEQKVAEHLRSIAEKETIAADDDALLLIARYGNGSFRDSISLLDQLSADGGTITRQKVEATLGLVDGQHIDELIRHIIAHETKPLISALKVGKEEGISPIVLSEQLVRELSTKADSEPRLYELVDQLLDVPRAHNPFIKLIATLVAYCESRQAHASPVSPRPQTAAARATPRPVISAPVATTSPAPTPAEPVIVNDASIEPAQPSTRPSTAPLGAFDWAAVLAVAKTHNAPLYSVLNRARPEYDGSTLTLYFMFALHRKKLEQAQYHSQLTKLISDVCGSCPPIVIKDGKTMTEEAEAVAAIMGGGEPVNAV